MMMVSAHCEAGENEAEGLCKGFGFDCGVKYYAFPRDRPKLTTDTNTVSSLETGVQRSRFFRILLSLPLHRRQDKMDCSENAPAHGDPQPWYQAVGSILALLPTQIKASRAFSDPFRPPLSNSGNDNPSSQHQDS